MDTLSVATQHDTSTGAYTVSFQWKQQGAKQPSMGGVVNVALHERYSEDRAVLAELSALHHLLCVEQIHGVNRLGNGLSLEVTSGAIRRALAKKSLKQDGEGLTEKQHVAVFAQFLATKLFEAKVEVRKAAKWSLEEPRQVHYWSIAPDRPPSVAIASRLGDVILSRHALNRFVERITSTEDISNGKSLADIPDYRWTRAWRSLETILPVADVVDIPDDEKRRISKKHGQGIKALYHEDSQSVFITKAEPYGTVIVTTLKNSRYCRLVRNLPRYINGREVY